MGTWNCSLYGPSQSTPFVNEKIKFKAAQKREVSKKNTESFCEQNILRNKSTKLPCLGMHIWMEYIGASALPRSFLSMALGSPPHIIGWLKPPEWIKFH